MVKRIRHNHETIFVSDNHTHWMLLLVLAAIVGFGLLIVTQIGRLTAYDSWYMCEIYGKTEFCQK